MIDPQLFAFAATHVDCLPTIERVMAEHGCEVTVSIHRPRRWTAFHREIVCGHGVRHFTHPTTAQFEKWKQLATEPPRTDR